MVNRCLLLLICLAAGLILMSCKQNAGFDKSVESENLLMAEYEKDSFYYCGYFVFTSDSSYFEDCATGHRFRLIDNSQLENIRARYEAMAVPQSIEMFGSMRGTVHYKPSSGVQLEVVKFLGFNQVEGCNPNAVMSDVYTVMVVSPTSPRYRITIKLNSNYEFEWSEYDYQLNKENILSGEWGRVSEEDILFKVKEVDGVLKQEFLSAYFDFPNMQLCVDTIKLRRK